METKETVRRLRAWIEVLRKAPDEKFDMSKWGYADEALKKKLDKGQAVCTTAACAAGWATVLPFAKREKFVLLRDANATHHSMLGYVAILDKEGFQDDICDDAVARLFGISQDQAAGITQPDAQWDEERVDANSWKPSKRAVIARIERVIAEVKQ